MKRDDMGMRIDEIRKLATEYDKQKLAQMVQMGLVEPQKAVMAGMMIDRIAKSAMQPPQTTVAQDVLGMAPIAGQMPAQGQMPPEAMQGQPPQMPQEAPPQMAANGGIMGMLPYSDGVAALPTNIPDYAGGGIIAFADRGAVKDPYQIEKANFRELDMPTDRSAQTEITRRDELQRAFGFNPGEFFSQRATEAKAERDKLKTREEESTNKALTKGFLRAAAGKARGNTLSAFLANAAEGAIGGMEAYEGMQKDIREQERLLREIDRKDAEAKFLHQRGDVDAAAKRIDEGEKLKMEVKAKNAEIFNKGEEYRAKAETEKGANVFKETEATKRTGMQIAGQKDIAGMKGSEERMFDMFHQSELGKNPNQTPLETYKKMKTVNGREEARAKIALELEKQWNDIVGDMSGESLRKIKEMDPNIKTGDDYVKRKMALFDKYYGTGVSQGAGATNALPMPANKADAIVGQTYNTPRGPAKWDGTNFVQ
jgi:uncharacterized protein YegP (UPF0339 family)